MGESPDVDGWSAAGDTYAEVVKLSEEGVPFALGHEASIEHYVPAGASASQSDSIHLRRLKATWRLLSYAL